MYCKIKFLKMERIEKYGIDLKNEFNNNFLMITNKLKKQYNNEIEFVNVRYSPEIGLSTFYNFYYDFKVVEINWWNIIYQNKVIANIFTMYEITGTFFEIEME